MLLVCVLRRFAAQRHRRCQECVSARIQSGEISDGWYCPRRGSRRSFADRVGRLGWFLIEERTWEPFKENFEAAPEFLANELKKLRVARAIAARIKSEFGIQL